MNRPTTLIAFMLVVTACTHGESQTHEGMHHGQGAVLEHRAEIEPLVGVELDPGAGHELGQIYESYLSPHQEAGEERDVPA